LVTTTFLDTSRDQIGVEYHTLYILIDIFYIYTKDRTYKLQEQNEWEKAHESGMRQPSPPISGKENSVLSDGSTDTGY
jgi:hypothetical protein